MQKKILFIIVALILTTLVYLAFNWKSLLLDITGFQYPKIENAQSLKSWSSLEKQHNLLAVTSTEENFNYLQENFGVPGIMVFDKDGLLIISNRGDGCQITARSKLKDLGKVDFPIIANKNSGIPNIEKLYERLSIINKAELKNKDEYDFTVVYTWAKYLPKQSTEMMEAVISGLKENKSKVLLLSLNLDYIDKWSSGAVGSKVNLD